MKTRIAFALCLGVCSLSVLLPLGIFYIQDSVAVDKDIVHGGYRQKLSGCLQSICQFLSG